MATTDLKNWTRDFFLSNKHSCEKILENVNNILQEIPSLNTSSLDNFKQEQFVRFHGMVQDMHNPEYFFEDYEVVNTNNGESSVRNGMYLDSPQCLPHENIPNESQKHKLSSRQSCFVISVPGLNEWAKEKVSCCNFDNIQRNFSKRHFESDNEESMDCSEPIQKKEKVNPNETTRNPAEKENTSSFLSKEHMLNFPIPNENGKACIVKLYNSEDTLRLNEVYEIVGFLSVDPLHSVIHDSEECMNDIELQTHNPPASMIPRLHAVKLVPISKSSINNSSLISRAEVIRNDLKTVLSQLLFGDELAADYLICHLISSIYLRKDFLCLGSFPLNITNFPVQECKNFSKDLYNILTQLIPKSHYIELSLESLNDSCFIPKKDYQCDRLTSGILQLSDNTHLVINEMALKSGQLSAVGRQNYEALTRLVEFQTVNYDFQFFEKEFDTDIPVLILSEVKSFIPCSMQLPLKVDSQNEKLYPEVLEIAKQYLKVEDRLKNIREYLSTFRHTSFDIDENLYRVIQDDFVELRKENQSFKSDNLHVLLVFARLMSLSYGRNVLSVDIWKRALNFELQRMARLPRRK